MIKIYSVTILGAAMVLSIAGTPGVAADQGLSGPGVASSDEAPSGQLAEIVVTAQKRRENLQNVPIAVTAVSATDLEASGVSATTDLATVVPGLSFRDTYGQIQPHLRGVGTTFAGPGQENAVAFYVDDVYYGSAVATALTLADVEQVSVLKGPQGTLFGRNANGGVIQVTTRDPSEDASGKISTSIDNYLTSVSNLYVTGRLTDSLSGNFAAQFTTQGNGWGRNIANGDAVHRTNHNVALRGKLLFKPDELTTIKLSADFVDRLDSNGPNFVTYPGTISTFPGYQATANPWDVNSSITNRNKYTNGGISLSIDHDFTTFHLVSISAYRSDDLNTRFDPTATPTPANGIFISERTSQATQEIRLASSPGSNFSWAIGVFGFYGTGKDDPLGVTLNPAVTSYPGLSGGPAVFIDINSRETTKSGAVYAQGTQMVLPDTHLTVGLRYTAERRTYTGAETENLYFAGPILLSPPTAAPDMMIPVAPNQPLPPRESFGKLTYRFALDHQLTPDALGYVSYNRGFKSGGYNTQNPTNAPYLPETVDAYEVGAKTEWLGHRLRINTAAFYNKYQDIQVETFTNVSFFQNGAAAHTYGLDLDVQAKPAPNFIVTGGIEWVEAKFTSFPGANFYTVLPSGGATPYLADAAGKYLPNAPIVTGDLSLDYIREYAGGQLDLNLTDSYSGRYFQEPDNHLSQPAYDLVNAALGWTAPGGRLAFKFWTKNVFNKAIIGQMSTNGFGGTNVDFNADYSFPPRTYGISARYAF